MSTTAPVVQDISVIFQEYVGTLRWGQRSGFRSLMKPNSLVLYSHGGVSFETLFAGSKFSKDGKLAVIPEMVDGTCPLNRRACHALTTEAQRQRGIADMKHLHTVGPQVQQAILVFTALYRAGLSFPLTFLWCVRRSIELQMLPQCWLCWLTASHIRIVVAGCTHCLE